MISVLVVDDSEEIQTLVARALGSELRLREARTAREAEAALERESFDLVLLDVGLPDGNGFELCTLIREVRRTRDLPVLFLTGRTDVGGKVMAFSLGADDFVEKPFDPRELRARVQARLRRAAGHREILERGGIRLDVPRYRVEVLEEGGYRLVALTPNEFKLLHELVSNPERVLERPRLLEAVWGPTVVCERTVDSYVSQLRRKLGPRAQAIRAVRGVGYCFRPQEPNRGENRGDGP